MPFPGQPWLPHYRVVACIFHVIAVVSGIFRLTYRWYISRFGWDDFWASLALFTDIGCLIFSWLQQDRIPMNPTEPDLRLYWLIAITLTSVPWEARLSMITTIVRITDPRTSVRHTSYAIAIAFVSMWIALLVQVMYACAVQSCRFAHDVAISQIIVDTISDTLLVIVPLFFLKGMKISHSQRVLLFASFASSIFLTVLSIAQSIALFMPINATSLLFTHIKAALSVVICNLLVVVTFVYRVYHKIDVEVQSSDSGSLEFTTLVPGQLSLGPCTCSTSLQSHCIHCISRP